MVLSAEGPRQTTCHQPPHDLRTLSYAWLKVASCCSCCLHGMCRQHRFSLELTSLPANSHGPNVKGSCIPGSFIGVPANLILVFISACSVCLACTTRPQNVRFCVSQWNPLPALSPVDRATPHHTTPHYITPRHTTTATANDTLFGCVTDMKPSALLLRLLRRWRCGWSPRLQKRIHRYQTTTSTSPRLGTTAAAAAG